jgi:hypothetical protein
MGKTHRTSANGEWSRKRKDKQSKDFRSKRKAKAKAQSYTGRTR